MIGLCAPFLIAFHQANESSSRNVMISVIHYICIIICTASSSANRACRTLLPSSYHSTVVEVKGKLLCNYYYYYFILLHFIISIAPFLWNIHERLHPTGLCPLPQISLTICRTFHFKRLLRLAILPQRFSHCSSTEPGASPVWAACSWSHSSWASSGSSGLQRSGTAPRLCGKRERGFHDRGKRVRGGGGFGPALLLLLLVPPEVDLHTVGFSGLSW